MFKMRCKSLKEERLDKNGSVFWSRAAETFHMAALFGLRDLNACTLMDQDRTQTRSKAHSRYRDQVHKLIPAIRFRRTSPTFLVAAIAFSLYDRICRNPRVRSSEWCHPTSFPACCSLLAYSTPASRCGPKPPVKSIAGEELP